MVGPALLLSWRDLLVPVVATVLVPLPFAIVDTWSELDVLLEWPAFAYLAGAVLATVLGLRVPGDAFWRGFLAFWVSWLALGIVLAVMYREYGGGGGWLLFVLVVPLVGVAGHGLVAGWVTWRVRRARLNAIPTPPQAV